MGHRALDLQRARRARTRALVIPREHGAWGLLFIPLFTGVSVGIASSPSAGPVILFAIAAVALFWLRTPVESLLGTTPMSAETPEERRIAILVSLVLAGLAATCLAGLLQHGRHNALLLLGGLAAVLFAVQTLLMKLGRKLRLAAQLVGAIALTSTAVAAYYVATGLLDKRAFMLWAANWIFAANQILFVQLRIHAARARSFAEKLQRGRVFFFTQVLLLLFLFAASHWRLAPVLITLAFVPVLARGFYWFFQPPQPLQVKRLGWAEMKQGILFGILFASVLILS